VKKLLSQIKDSFFGLNKVLSVSINLSEDNLSLQGGLFKIKNGETDLETTFADLDLKEALAKMPVVLTLEGKGILHKLVDADISKIKLRNIIPNIKEDEFYVNYLPQGSQTWVSLIRKDLVDATLKTLRIPFDNIIDFHLSPCQVQWLNGKVEGLPKQIGDAEVEYQDGKLIGILKKSSPLNESLLFGNTVEKDVRLAMISSIVTFSGLNKNQVNSIWLNNRKNQEDKKVYYSTVKIVLGLLLVVFAGNMILGQLAKKDLNQLVLQTREKENIVNRAILLENEAKEKESFIVNLGLGSNPQFSKFSDEIGATVPKNIQLSKLVVNPLSKSIRKNKLIQFTNGTIQVGGYCKTSQDCNQWVTILRDLEWAEKVELVEFKVNKDNIGEFLVKVDF